MGRQEGNAIGPIRLEQRARVTLPLPVSVVGVCCCVNYSSSRSRRREQPSWNRFKWNVPPGSKQLPSCPAGRDSTRQRRAGLRARPAGLCARVLRGWAHLRAVSIPLPTVSGGHGQVQRSGYGASDQLLLPLRVCPGLRGPELLFFVLFFLLPFLCFLWSSWGIGPVLSPRG